MILGRRVESCLRCRSTSHSDCTSGDCSTSGSAKARTNRRGAPSSVLVGVKVLAVISGLLAALAVAGAAPATTPVPGETQALKALRVAPLDANTRADGRAEVTRAV